MGRLIETTQDEKTLSYYKYYETGLPEIPAERLALAAAPQPVGRGIPFDKKDDFILFPADKDYCYVGYGENEDGSCYAANQTFVPGGRPEMLEWWFVWQGVGPDLRYRLWDPEDHYFSKIAEVEQALDCSIPCVSVSGIPPTTLSRTSVWGRCHASSISRILWIWASRKNFCGAKVAKPSSAAAVLQPLSAIRSAS